jgi:hypothetical protein
VLSGLTLRGMAAVDLYAVTGWRVVGNDFSCPQGYGQSACFHADTTTNLSFLGNYVHNVGDAAGSIDKYFHAVYFTTNSNHIEAGWNTVVPNPTGSTTSGGCRAIQFYSTGGSDQFDLHVHDNVIHDAICDGINFSTVNADNGVVEAYNNVVYHVGTGPDPYNGSSNYACITSGTSGTPANYVDFYNNTMYDCGSRKNADSGTMTLYAKSRLRNNIMYQLAGEVYVGGSGGYLQPTGSNNLYYGLGNGPSGTTGNVNANPSVVSTSTPDFHLQSGSPAIDAGITISGLSTDIAGVVRPQGSAFDIGAYEYFLGSAPPPTTSACDLNADGSINVLDVQLAIDQTVGLASCTTAALVGNGTCTIVDIQRIADAALGGACVVGP